MHEPFVQTGFANNNMKYQKKKENRGWIASETELTVVRGASQMLIVVLGMCDPHVLVVVFCVIFRLRSCQE